MTVVSVQAGFGEYVFDSQPDEARAALGAIQAVSREALGEMQRMLCVLRQPDTEIAGGSRPRSARDLGGAWPSGSGLIPSGRPPRSFPRPAWLTWTGWCSEPGAPG